jgi:hypothetical protein
LPWNRPGTSVDGMTVVGSVAAAGSLRTVNSVGSNSSRQRTFSPRRLALPRGRDVLNMAVNSSEIMVPSGSLEQLPLSLR